MSFPSIICCERLANRLQCADVTSLASLIHLILEVFSRKSLSGPWILEPVILSAPFISRQIQKNQCPLVSYRNKSNPHRSPPFKGNYKGQAAKDSLMLAKDLGVGGGIPKPDLLVFINRFVISCWADPVFSYLASSTFSWQGNWGKISSVCCWR